MPTPSTKLVEQLTPALLRWSWSKTGDRAAAQDLVQEVWLQYFQTLRREKEEGRAVLQPEHLLWRVARYVWYRHLRQTRRHQAFLLDEQLPDPSDFAADLIQREEQAQQVQWIHQQVVRLGRIQREAIVLYYVEQWPQRRIAQHLGISEGALRWHLHDTRQRLKKGADHMTLTDHVFRPRQLCMGNSGLCVPDMATVRVNQDLLMQNILHCCHRQPRTIPEIAGMLGVAAPYIEHQVTFLTAQELLEEQRGRYATTFPIIDSALEKALMDGIARHRADVSTAIAQGLLAREDLIRSLGFIGSDRPMNKLLWWLLYQCCQYLPWPLRTPEAPLRPDGGRYYVRATDRTDRAEGSLANGWAYNGAIGDGGYRWFGLYNFGQSDIESLLDAWTPAWKALRELLDKLIAADFDLRAVTAQERPLLAELVQKGFLHMAGNRLVPSFCLLTNAQYDRLRNEVFLPLCEAAAPALPDLVADLRAILQDALPPRLHHLLDLETSLAIKDTAFVTLRLAFNAGLLYQPVDGRDGEFLTLFCIRP